MIERRIVRMTGRVQGVGFRASARDEADRRGVRGWVRNEPDGSVTIDAEGEPAALAAFIAWLRQGPPAARVDRLESAPAAPAGHDGFDVRRR